MSLVEHFITEGNERAESSQQEMEQRWMEEQWCRLGPAQSEKKGFHAALQHAASFRCVAEEARP